MSDTFVTWGWSDREWREPEGGSHFRTSRVRIAPADRRDPYGLFVSTTDKRYLIRFNSSPLATEAADKYFDGQVQFLEALPAGVRRRVRFRPYPGQRHPRRTTIASRFPDVAWDEGPAFADSAARAAIVIIDHPVTSMLDALAANVPTLLFWDPELWELRPSAAPYFETLRAAGILYASPGGAAAHYSAVIDDPDAWWQTAAVQHARDVFVDRFARAAHDWKRAWLANIDAAAAVEPARAARRASLP
jgi:putative transferase (TIGR04331 family)